MMRTKTFWAVLSVGMLAGVLALTALPVGIADARQQASPTPGGLGGLAIATATPMAAEPTAQSPAEPTTEPSQGGTLLPTLDEASLEALNLAAEDVPAQFAANREATTYSLSDLIEQVRPASAELADTMQALSDEYAWYTSVGVAYTACEPSIPVSKIYSEIGQLGSPDLARAFVDDPRLPIVYQTVGYTTDPSELAGVHGWLTSMSVQPTCFDAETEYNLNFDYQGLLISASVAVNSATDMALVEDLLSQLAAILVAKVDVLGQGGFAPTPVGPVVMEPTEAPLPTEAALPTTAPEPTEATQPTPKPTTSGLLFGATATPAGSSGDDDDMVLQQIDAVMPTIDELALPQPPFVLNTELTGISTADELVADLQSVGLTELASAVQQANTANNLLGQVTYVWGTGDECPSTAGLSVESDVAMFESAKNAQAYLADPAIRQAWLNTGIFQTYDITDGTVTAQGTITNQCGEVTLYAQVISSGRFSLTALVVAYSTASEVDMQGVVDSLNQFVLQKMDAAGIE
ncbi:hypothetical protein [Aggregatilinea lenta]|uniref:hypothetical protein n=1 Tax=Aggregatilinea lenta TaxID=913108 RepID=UPI0013C36F1A|nr:hypothetical protein [Aggregatilinea lenta]